MCCFKCSIYGHTAENCSSEIEICPKCSGHHSLKNYKSDHNKCPNCVATNEKFKLDLDVNHNAWDVNCPLYKRRFKSVKNRLVYDDQ